MDLVSIKLKIKPAAKLAFVCSGTRDADWPADIAEKKTQKKTLQTKPEKFSQVKYF